MADQKAAKPDAPAPATAPAKRVEDIPDPDEDDLDDLDDVLDEFSATKLDDGKPVAQQQPTSSSSSAAATAQQPASAASKPAPAPGAAPGTEDDIDEAEFAKQLQAGMAELLGGLGESPEMAQQLENLVKELGTAPAPGAGAASGSGSGSGSGSSSAKPASVAEGSKKQAAAGEDNFQEQIRRTMERMQASGEQASAAAASSSGSNPDDILAQMLAEMEKGGFGGEGGEFGSDEDFSKMLMGMMEQLTNKEILYEPMKELYDKFPAWLEKNREKTDKADLDRYEEQQRCVKDIVERFERPGYSDDSAADREFIVERMQKMQAAGSPPQDLVGDMTAAQEALGELDQGCATQ